MFSLVITIHIVVCLLLIITVLIQQGRGGGLIDSLSSAESVFGTKTNSFLVKSTSIFAIVFFVTCLSLAFFSIQKSKSLIETKYKPQSAAGMPFAMPGNGTQPAAASAVKTETPAAQGAASMPANAPKTESKKTENPPVQGETK